jgi:hypothetical protein
MARIKQMSECKYQNTESGREGGWPLMNPIDEQTGAHTLTLGREWSLTLGAWSLTANCRLDTGNSLLEAALKARPRVPLIVARNVSQILTPSVQSSVYSSVWAKVQTSVCSKASAIVSRQVRAHVRVDVCGIVRLDVRREVLHVVPRYVRGEVSFEVCLEGMSKATRGAREGVFREPWIMN